MLAQGRGLTHALGQYVVKAKFYQTVKRKKIMNTNESKIKLKNPKFLGLSIIFIIVLFTYCPVVKYNNPTDGAGGLAMQLLDSLKTTFSIDSPLKLVVSGNPSAISEGKNASVLLKMSKAVTASIKVTIK